MEITKIEVKSRSRKLKHRWTITEENITNIFYSPVIKRRRDHDYRAATIWRRLFG